MDIWVDYRFGLVLLLFFFVVILSCNQYSCTDLSYRHMFSFLQGKYVGEKLVIIKSVYI